jgi:aldose 1-epimerase
MSADLTLRSENLEAVLLPEQGGRLHRLSAFGVDVVRTPADTSGYAQDPFFWGAYPMAPWCNRLSTEPIEVLGRMLELPANFPDGTAIHGQVYARPWQQTGPRTLQVCGGGDRWPWPYELTLTIRLEADEIGFDYRLANLADEPMPAGLGWHPWFRKPVQVMIPSSTVYEDNTATTPEPVPVAPPFDLRTPAVMADGIDATWPHPEGDPSLHWRESGLTMSMSCSPTAQFIVAANFADIEAVAFEPQTHAPDGLGRLLRGDPGALTILQPEHHLDLSFTLSFTLS